MKSSVRKRLTTFSLAGLLFLPAAIRAQEKAPEPPKDPQREFLQSLLRQANQEIRDFFQAKGKHDPAKNPARKWAEVFWAYHLAHPGGSQSTQAAREAIFMLGRSEDVDGAYAKAATLGPDHPAWPRVLPMLSYFGSEHRDRFIAFAEKLVAQTQREQTKVVAHHTLAEAYRRKDTEKAKTHLRAAIEAAKAAPDARLWADSESFLYELNYLNVGQTFPSFTAPTTDEKTFRPEDYRGKVVLLNFWATW
jgi:hypothetical protein